MIKANSNISQKMGRRIQEIRQQKNWSQAQLAEKLNVHPQTVSDAERGKNRFTIERLLRFFDALGYNAEIVLEKHTPKTEPELNDIQKTLAEHLEELKSEFDVQRIGIFGSAARNQADASSDIDLLIEFQPGKEGGAIKLQQLQKKISNLLDGNIDLTPSYALSNKEFSQNIKKDIIYV
jgi:hypothetical protein